MVEFCIVLLMKEYDMDKVLWVVKGIFVGEKNKVIIDIIYFED